MTRQRLALGKWGEDRAVEFLRRKGLDILERNFATPIGEIDIIAREGSCVVFVEVKTRRGIAFGAPQEAVGPTKQRQILRTAQWYLGNSRGRISRLQPRFDVVAVRQVTDGARIEHIPDAFGA